MREYPDIFKGNIESRDTNIFPVLVFGIDNNWIGEASTEMEGYWQRFPSNNNFQDFLFLSTTNCNLTLPDNTSFDAAPILLNLSNLKESLDIEKGNYKVSNLTVSISNSPYGGKRFSDAIDELESTYASLNGMTARVFWVSQSSARILGTIDKFSCYPSFSGIVNKYSYSKDIATIVLEEDTSLRIAYKEFPSKSVEDLSDTVPEAYTGKPVPIVYGEVEHSPCVVINEVDSVYSNPEHPTEVPTIYCDSITGDNGSYIDNSTENAFDNSYSEDGITPNFNLISFLNNNDYVNISMFYWKNPLTSENGTNTGGNLDMLYRMTGDDIFPSSQYYYPTGDYISGDKVNKLIIANIPRNSNLEGSADETDSSSDIANTNISDGIVFCNSIVYPESVRLFNESDSYNSIVHHDWWNLNFKYSIDYITNVNTDFGINAEYDDKILLSESGNLSNLCKSTPDSAHYYMEALLNEFYIGENVIDESQNIPDDNYRIRDWYRIGLTMAGQPTNNLQGFPIHYTFIGNVNYQALSFGQLTYGDINTEPFNNSGAEMRIDFGHTQVEENISPSQQYSGRIILSNNNATLSGHWCNYPCEAGFAEINRLNGFANISGYNFSCTLSAPYDPVLTVKNNSTYWTSYTPIENTYQHASLVGAELNNIRFLAQFYVGNFKYTENQIYANKVIGRVSSDPTPPKIISNLLTYELSEDNETLSGLSVNKVPQFDDEEYSDWKYATTIHEKKEAVKFIQELLSVSPYLMRYNHIEDQIEFKGIKSTYDVNDINNAYDTSLIKIEDVIDFSFSRTKIEDIYHAVSFHYKWDYGKERFLKNYTFSYDDALQFKDEDGEIIYNIKYHGEAMSKKILTIDDERGKYIRDEDTAKAFTIWKFYQNCNQHLKIKVKLPLKYMKYEPGDIVAFDELIKDIKPYGINYKYDAEFDIYLGDRVNNQQVYPLFIINSMSKGLVTVEMECTQLHNLRNNIYSTIDGSNGCMDPSAWNYDENATIEPTGACIFPGNFLVPASDWGCPVLESGEYDEGDEDVLDVSTNFAGNGTYADDFNIGDNIFIASTNDEYNALTSKELGNEGDAYLAWLAAGAEMGPTTWDAEGALKIYRHSHCIWQDKVPHNIISVSLCLNNKDGSELELLRWTPTSEFGTLLASKTLDYNLVNDIVYGNQFTTEDDDVISASLKFDFLVPEEHDDFSFAGNNSLEWQMKNFYLADDGDFFDVSPSDLHPDEGITIEGSHLIENFSKNDNIYNNNDQTYTIKSDFTWSIGGLGSFIWSMSSNYYIALEYDLNINTEPSQTTELFRDKEFIFSITNYEHSPLVGDLHQEEARSNNKKLTIADVLEVANSEKIDSELLLETIKKVTGG
tara:strand:- start:7097 stop:11176 length:4080 start_codon:yes stop_codon:yes gene_type:complete